MPVHPSLSVVDIGAMRFFDARQFPHDAFLTHAPADAAIRQCDQLPALPYHVWVLPAGFQCVLPSLFPDALGVMFSWLANPGRGCAPGSLLPALDKPPRPPAKTMVYIDGWRADTVSADFVRPWGVELLLELPTLVDPTSQRTVREMLDQAARGP